MNIRKYLENNEAISIIEKLNQKGIKTNEIKNTNKKPFAEIFISGDINDADYVNNIETIDDLNNNKNFNDLLKLIKIKSKVERYDGKYNYENMEKYLSSSEIDFFTQFTPRGINDDRVHTIEEIKITIHENGNVYKII